MKNMKKLVSLILAVCLMASLAIGASAAEPTTVDVSGGTGTSSVSLSSTSDGTLDGDPAATKMNVAIPTILPIAVGTDGTVTTATDIRITNNSFGAVKVDNVKVEAGTGWKLTAFGSKDSLAKVKVDSNMIASSSLWEAARSSSPMRRMRLPRPSSTVPSKAAICPATATRAQTPSRSAMTPSSARSPKLSSTLPSRPSCS